ncbi:MAG: cation transporter [Acidimicrobiia bacterium]|nr:cation transporter [Acidimicrobiia bacterium]MDX2466687.1 cation transporter [Acidimicrobiia bacterium]
MPEEKTQLESQAMRLEYATIAWNAFEMVIAIGLGIAARSLALVAFGLDTMVELFASGVVVWHLRHPSREDDLVTARALRLVAAAFAVLAAVVASGAIWALVTRSAPEESPLGIAYLGLTVVVMLSLGLAKRTVGRRLGSEPVMAEARMSVLDAALALGVLIGLAANVLFGWWWADPIAALLVAAAAVNEAIENREEAMELVEGAAS